MRLATKISTGFGVLIALVIAVLSYQISLIHQMQSINRDLSGIEFRSAMVSLELLRDVDYAEEFTRKFFATAGDPDYASELEDMRYDFSQRLIELQALPASTPERQQADELSRQWQQFSKTSAEQNQRYHSMADEQIESSLFEQLDLLTRLKTQVQLVIAATQQAIASRVAQSLSAAKHAERISWVAAATAFFLSLGVSLWIIRSISTPLRYLTAGTRAVAEGNFYYQLDSSGADELAQLARDFNIMTRRLSELDNLKKDFVSHVSHELKTPLASIEETIRLLLEEIPGPLNDQQKRFLELNLQSGKRLSALIRNLLDLSRMDAGVMHYEMKRHNLADLARTAVAEFAAPLREKAFQLETQIPAEPVPVQCDADRMVQVLGNLIGNALKFAPRGSYLRVGLTILDEAPKHAPKAWRQGISSAAARGGYALLSVADSGPGVPPAEKEKIFEKFHQVSHTSGQGAGLGLSIARTIVGAHGGAIWVEDNPGGGSVFYVLLVAGVVGEPATIRTSHPV